MVLEANRRYVCEKSEEPRLLDGKRIYATIACKPLDEPPEPLPLVGRHVAEDVEKVYNDKRIFAFGECWDRSVLLGRKHFSVTTGKFHRRGVLPLRQIYATACCPNCIRCKLCGEACYPETLHLSFQHISGPGGCLGGYGTQLLWNPGEHVWEDTTTPVCPDLSLRCRLLCPEVFPPPFAYYPVILDWIGCEAEGVRLDRGAVFCPSGLKVNVQGDYTTFCTVPEGELVPDFYEATLNS